MNCQYFDFFSGKFQERHHSHQFGQIVSNDFYGFNRAFLRGLTGRPFPSTYSQTLSVTRTLLRSFLHPSFYIDRSEAQPERFLGDESSPQCRMRP